MHLAVTTAINSTPQNEEKKRQKSSAWPTLAVAYHMKRQKSSEWPTLAVNYHMTANNLDELHPFFGMPLCLVRGGWW